MPTKLNRAGQQQNYVPKGNGDASGEYGDNNSGSNVHYKVEGSEKTDTSNVGKGNDISAKTEQKSDKINYNGKDYADQTEITNIIMKKMGISKLSENVQRVIAQLNGDNIDKDIRNVVLSTLESDNYKIQARKDGAGVYYPWKKTISFSSTEELGRTNGEVMFHECGHALDHQYNNGRGLWSQDYKSTQFGKSMIAMKDEELGNALRNGGYDKLVAEYEELKSKNQEQIDKIRDEIIPLDKEIKQLSKFPDDLQQQIDKLSHDETVEFYNVITGKTSYAEYNEKRREILQKIDSIKKSYNNPNVSKIEQLSEKVSQLSGKINTLHQEAYYSAVEKYSDISDMCEAMGYKAFAGGHGRKYWTSSHCATECFAEIQSAMGTNKASFELLQKYIPNTIKIYKEIIGEIHNGKK